MATDLAAFLAWQETDRERRDIMAADIVRWIQEDMNDFCIDRALSYPIPHIHERSRPCVKKSEIAIAYQRAGWKVDLGQEKMTKRHHALGLGDYSDSESEEEAVVAGLGVDYRREPRLRCSDLLHGTAVADSSEDGEGGQGRTCGSFEGSSPLLEGMEAKHEGAGQKFLLALRSWHPNQRMHGVMEVLPTHNQGIPPCMACAEGATAAGASEAIPGELGASTGDTVGLLQSLPLELRQPPPGAPPPDLVAKCEKILNMKRLQGRSFNEALRKNKVSTGKFTSLCLTSLRKNLVSLVPLYFA